MDYCTATDVYRQLPPGSLPNPGRLVSAVSTTTDTLTLDGHGLATDDTVTLRADAGGSMPSPLVAGTVYYAKVVTESTFQLATTAGGAVVNISTAGSNVILVVPLPMAEWITSASAEIEQTMPAHAPDLESSTGTVPVVIRDYCARLAALRALVYVGASTLDIERMISLSQKLADRWLKSIPIYGSNAPASTNYALAGTSSSTGRGWGSNGSSIP